MKAHDPDRMPPPLPPSIEALLTHERADFPQPEMVRARTLARAREALRSAPWSTLSPHSAPKRVRRLLLAAAAGITFMAGVAAAYQMLARPMPTPPAVETPQVPRHTPVAAPAPQVIAAASSQAAPAPVAPLADVASTRVPAPDRHTVLNRKNDGGMEELRLLDHARQLDARGNYGDVLAVVSEHARGYPAGRLSEEREVLRVKALVGLGHSDEARQAAANFRRHFPRSVLLQKIDDMLASLP